jgi:hypothetical protein
LFYGFRGALPTVSRSGYCWTGSLATERNDAWRCLVGNLIYDPCFSSSDAPGVVICPFASLRRGVEIYLSRALPRRYAGHQHPSLAGNPWNIELADGEHCVFITGATTVVDGKRLSYVCPGRRRYGLWGRPIRRAEPWTIIGAAFTATHLHGRRLIKSLVY